MLSTHKHNTTGSGDASEMEGPDNDYTTLGRPELVPRDNATGNRANEVILTLKFTSVECKDWGSNLKYYKEYA